MCRLFGLHAGRRAITATFWLLEPGELVHIDADLNITSSLEFPDPPAHLLRRSDLSPTAQAAQHRQGGSAAQDFPGAHGE